MEENPDAKLKELVRAKVRMINLTHDSALIDSDPMPMSLVHKMSTPMLQFAQFVNTAEFGIFLNNVLSTSISVNSAEKIKKSLGYF
ncbi:hypothetical protein ACTXT7_005044 [Hymenolepis weldensis]